MWNKNKLLRLYFLLMSIFLFNCNSYQFLNTNDKYGNNDTKKCIKNIESLKYNGKKIPILIIKNKKDNRYYLGVKNNKIITTIEINCDNNQFIVNENSDDFYDNKIAIELYKNSNIPKVIRFGNLLTFDPLRTVCEFNKDGKMSKCILRKLVFEIDSLNRVKKTYLY